MGLGLYSDNRSVWDTIGGGLGCYLACSPGSTNSFGKTYSFDSSEQRCPYTAKQDDRLEFYSILFYFIIRCVFTE